MQSKTKYYLEFGLFNQSIILSPVYHNAEEILLAINIRGCGTGGITEFESRVALCPSKTHKDDASRKVYKGLCRFGKRGLVGVHTLTIINNKDMVLHHSPSPTMREIISNELNKAMSSLKGPGEEGYEIMPPNTIYLKRDEFIENKSQHHHNDNNNHISRDPSAYLVTVLSKTVNNENVNNNNASFSFMEMGTEAEAADETLFPMFTSPDSRDPRSKPEGFNCDDDVNGDGDDNNQQTSGDAILKNMNFSDMMQKYSNFGSSQLGETAKRLGIVPASPPSHKRSNDGENDSVLTSNTGRGTLASTHDRIQEALRGTTKSPVATVTKSTTSSTSASSPGDQTNKTSNNVSNVASDKALGIAERLASSLKNSTKGISSSGDSFYSGIDSINGLGPSLGGSVLQGSVQDGCSVSGSHQYRSALGLGNANDDDSHTRTHTAVSTKPRSSSTGSGSLKSAIGSKSNKILPPSGKTKRSTSISSSSGVGEIIPRPLRPRSSSRGSHLSIGSFGSNKTKGTIGSTTSSNGTTKKKLPSYMQGTKSSSSTRG